MICIEITSFGVEGNRVRLTHQKSAISANTTNLVNCQVLVFYAVWQAPDLCEILVRIEFTHQTIGTD